MTALPDTTTEAGQKKASIMLARIMGWEVEPDDYKGWIRCPGEPYATTNLYHPVFMFLAWRVLNWINEWMANGGAQKYPDFCDDIIGSLDISLSPAAAQRAWLDKILSLAIEVGMVQEN